MFPVPKLLKSLNVYLIVVLDVTNLQVQLHQIPANDCGLLFMVLPFKTEKQ